MQTNSRHQQFYPGHGASRGYTCTRRASRRHATGHILSGLIALFNPAQLFLLLTDPGQRLTFPVKLRSCLTNAGFKATLVSRQRAGVYPGLCKLGALALYRLPEPVQVSGGFFCRLHRARLRFGGVFRVFKLDGQRCGLLFRFVKRLTGHGKLCARFPESVNSGRLRVKVAQGRL